MRQAPSHLRSVLSGSSLTKMLYWGPLVFVTTQYFYVPLGINGKSMQPTLNPDTSITRDIGLFDRFSITVLHKYARGDIVALRSPTNPGRILVKRIIGVPGDTIHTVPPYTYPTVKVPEHHVWVEGDEPFNSDSSNHFGPLPVSLLDSKLVSIIWPLDRFGTVQPAALPTETTGPAYRLAMDAINRERWRESRVKRPSE